MLTVTKETIINGYDLNNPSSYPGLFKEPTDRLIDLIEHARETFSRPQGYHLRFRLGDGVSISKFLDRLKKAYTRPGRSRKIENTFTPLYLWACENDTHHRDTDADGARYGSGVHFHMAFILDGRKATGRSLHTLRDKFVADGTLLDMKIVPTMDSGDRKTYCQSLNNGAELHAYVYWLSYICKVRTKSTFIGSGKRKWGGSRIPKMGTPFLDCTNAIQNHKIRISYSIN